MNNLEFGNYVSGIKCVDYDGLDLEIVDSVGVLLSVELKRNSNHFDALIDYIYMNYYNKDSVEKIYMLLESLAKTLILEHYKKNIGQNRIIHIDCAYTGEAEMLLIDFNDKAESNVSACCITNLKCKEMNIGFKQAFLSDKLPVNLANMYLMNV